MAISETFALLSLNSTLLCVFSKIFIHNNYAILSLFYEFYIENLTVNNFNAKIIINIGKQTDFKEKFYGK